MNYKKKYLQYKKKYLNIKKKNNKNYVFLKSIRNINQEGGLFVKLKEGDKNKKFGNMKYFVNDCGPCVLDFLFGNHLRMRPMIDMIRDRILDFSDVPKENRNINIPESLKFKKSESSEYFFNKGILKIDIIIMINIFLSNKDFLTSFIPALSNDKIPDELDKSKFILTEDNILVNIDLYKDGYEYFFCSNTCILKKGWYLYNKNITTVSKNIKPLDFSINSIILENLLLRKIANYIPKEYAGILFCSAGIGKNQLGHFCIIARSDRYKNINHFGLRVIDPQHSFKIHNSELDFNPINYFRNYFDNTGNREINNSALGIYGTISIYFTKVNSGYKLPSWFNSGFKLFEYFYDNDLKVFDDFLKSEIGVNPKNTIKDSKEEIGREEEIRIDDSKEEKRETF